MFSIFIETSAYNMNRCQNTDTDKNSPVMKQTTGVNFLLCASLVLVALVTTGIKCSPVEEQIKETEKEATLQRDISL